MDLQKALNLRKARTKKYIRRVKTKGGKYRYIYKDAKQTITNPPLGISAKVWNDPLHLEGVLEDLADAVAHRSEGKERESIKKMLSKVKEQYKKLTASRSSKKKTGVEKSITLVAGEHDESDLRRALSKVSGLKIKVEAAAPMGGYGDMYAKLPSGKEIYIDQEKLYESKTYQKKIEQALGIRIKQSWEGDLTFTTEK